MVSNVQRFFCAHPGAGNPSSQGVFWGVGVGSG